MAENPPSDFNFNNQNCEKLEFGIFLLGKAGSGKGATGNTILGRNIFAEDSVTRTCKTYCAEVEGRNIWVIDTPDMTLEGVRTIIKNCLSSLVIDSYVFLLVIKSTSTITKEEANHIQWIEENFGKEALLHTIVLFTHSDKIGEKSFERFVNIRSDLKLLVNSCGNRYQMFNNTDPRRSQVTELMGKIDNMIRVNGGQCYTLGMYQEFCKKIREEQKEILIAVTIAGLSAICLSAVLAAMKQ